MTQRPRLAPELDKPGLQPERTALAWERTAIVMMVSGLLLARFAARDAHWVFALIGLAQTVAGSGVLVWAGAHYNDLHGPIARGDGVVHPGAARAIGLSAVTFTGLALLLAIAVSLAG